MPVDVNEPTLNSLVSRRKRLSDILNVERNDDAVGHGVDVFLISLISLNVLAIILQSVESIDQRFHAAFVLFEIFSVVVFTVEYVLRVWSCIDTEIYARKGPVLGRISFMLQPMILIDLAVILPFYLLFFVSIDLRFLRVMRLLRVFKLTRYSAAMDILLSVLRKEASSFFAAFFILIMLLILASSFIYLIEHEVQPVAFGSIPAAMWWSMATLTTVGYGDVTPITALGKFFGGCITAIGIGMVALPAGILASGFSEQLNRRQSKQEPTDTLENTRLARSAISVSVCPHCKQPLPHSLKNNADS